MKKSLHVWDLKKECALVAGNLWQRDASFYSNDRSAGRRNLAVQDFFSIDQRRH
jgi:hypothetical protein